MVIERRVSGVKVYSCFSGMESNCEAIFRFNQHRRGGRRKEGKGWGEEEIVDGCY